MKYFISSLLSNAGIPRKVRLNHRCCTDIRILKNTTLQQVNKFRMLTKQREKLQGCVCEILYVSIQETEDKVLRYTKLTTQDKVIFGAVLVCQLFTTFPAFDGKRTLILQLSSQDPATHCYPLHATCLTSFFLLNLQEFHILPCSQYIHNRNCVSAEIGIFCKFVLIQ